MKVRVLPGAFFVEGDKSWQAGDEFEMAQGEAALRISEGKVEPVDTADDPGNLSKLSAAEMIAAVKAAQTMTALSELAVGEERKTVLTAIDSRKQELGQP